MRHRHGAPETVVEALAYQLRGGFEALRESSAAQRISELDEPQMRDIAGRLTKERRGKSKSSETPPRVPPWKPNEIEAFIRIWRLANEGH